MFTFIIKKLFAFVGKFVLLAAITSLGIGLRADTLETWSIGNHHIVLDKCPRGYCRIHCPQAKSCLAMDYHKTPLKGEMAATGGANPGAGVCRARSGHVSILRDKDGNEMAMCRFHDQSMISVDGLWVW